MRGLTRKNKNLDKLLEEMYRLRIQRNELDTKLSRLTEKIVPYVQDEMNPISKNVEERTVLVDTPEYQFHVAADIGTRMEDVLEALTRSRIHIDAVTTLTRVADRDLLRKHPAIAKKLPVHYKITSIRPRI